MDNIILIGMPGSGKSSVGVVLAKALGRRFLDVDLLIQQREGALLQQLIDSRGVERFLDLERDAICSLNCRGTVIAPGGSCVCREESIAHMRALGTVVYLELPLEEVAGRIRNLDSRGVALSPGQTLADVYRYRAPLYERCAHITVPAGGRSMADTVEAVKNALAKHDNEEVRRIAAQGSLDRSEGERRAVQRPADQPESEGKRPGRAANPQHDNIKRT